MVTLWNKYKLRLPLVAAISLILAGCARSHMESKLTVLKEISLRTELKETSGLSCKTKNQLYSINDSGNEPVVYQLDPSGDIEQQFSLELKNRDWEAISDDGTHLYVADIGNNWGKHQHLYIYKLAKEQITQGQVDRLKLQYADNDPTANSPLAHDYDAEALVALDEHLLLFSKSWKSQNLSIYQVDKNNTTEQKLNPVRVLNDINGLITGADYDRQNKRFVLVGYQVGGLRTFAPFLLLLSDDMQLLDKLYLPGYAQVEGVCVDPTGDIWFTQEASTFSSAKLVQTRLKANINIIQARETN